MTPEQAAALRKPFDKKHIGKLPKGGAMLDFCGHAIVTDRLLTVDPLWTWEPVAFDSTGLPAYDAKGGLWIRLTICGVTRLGYGDGPDPKQRIGDAIRNGAMRFGVALDLWSKQELEGDPNGGDAQASPVHTVQDFQAKHGDPSGWPEAAKIPATDAAWMADWRHRLSVAANKDAYAELYRELKSQNVAGDCTADDADTLLQEWQAGKDQLLAMLAEAAGEPRGELTPQEAAAS